MIYLKEDNTMWFGWSDGFWGALLGAAISGLFAVGVYALGKWQERKKNKEIIKNSNWIVMFVHKKVEQGLNKYIEEAEAKKDMSSEVHKFISELSYYKLYLDKIDFKMIFNDNKVLTNTIEYIRAYDELMKIIKFDDYGYLFVKYTSDPKTKETNFDILKKLYAEMKMSVKNLN